MLNLNYLVEKRGEIDFLSYKTNFINIIKMLFIILIFTIWNFDFNCYKINLNLKQYY